MANKWLVYATGIATLLCGVIWANAPPSPLPQGARADLLVVEEAQRRLLAYSGN